MGSRTQLRVHAYVVEGGRVVHATVQSRFRNEGPGITIRGLTDTAQDAIRDTLSAAICACCGGVAAQGITAEVKTTSKSHLVQDPRGLSLPIAMAVLASLGKVPRPDDGISYFGDLDADGFVVPTGDEPLCLTAAALSGRTLVCAQTSTLLQSSTAPHVRGLSRLRRMTTPLSNSVSSKSDGRLRTRQPEYHV